MNASLVFVEFICIGGLAGFALCLGLFGLGFRVPGFDQVPSGLWPVIGASLGLGVAYPLGMVIDSLADRFLGRLGGHYRDAYQLGPADSVFSLAMNKDKWNDFMDKYFEYNRVRTRIMRSMVLNAALMLIGGSLALNSVSASPLMIALWVGLWLLVGSLACMGLFDARKSWFKLLAVAYDKPIHKNPPSEIVSVGAKKA